MRLKRLELYGFKSFADRTLLDFEDALTGIVGPNGCGKSNVVDAIRWVLGERRPTSMRGSEMTDVIFKGSASRPALGVAEVTMTLDNTLPVESAGQGSEGVDAHRFAIEDRGPEVSITRRVFQSGEGEYLIDGERVRLKDVREMLFDTGLGSRGYSVLEQGKIDAVLSADALERRTIFEEAAGISRYRQRRKEAESRLGRVQRDLERLDDVLRELQTRSRSLKIQAGKAQRYVEAKGAWRAGATRLARLQVRAIDRELEELIGDLDARGSREAELREARAVAEQEAAGRGREQEALGAEVDRLSATAAELAGDLRALDERRHQLESRIAAWRTGGDGEEERADALERRLAERGSELSELRRQADELRDEVQEAEGRVGAATRALRAALSAAREARRASEERNAEVLNHLHERTAAQNAVQHIERSLAPHRERAARATERRDEAGRSLLAARAVAEEALVSVQAAEAAIAQADVRRGALAAERESLEARLAELREDQRGLELERERATSRVQALRDREHEREGLSAGAQALLDHGAAGPAETAADDGGGNAEEHTEEHTGAHAAPRIAGLLADHLRAATEHARALDAALGETARALVAEDLDGAATALVWLAEREAGLARFVAPCGFGALGGRGESGGPSESGGQGEAHNPGQTGLGSPSPDPAASARLLEDAISGLPAELAAGVRGPLRSLIAVDPGFEALADRLLEGVVLVDGLEVARALGAQRPGLTCVTPAGDLLGGGVLTGGWREVAHGPVGRRASAAALDEEVARLDARLESLDEVARGLEAERARVVAALADAEGELLGRRDALAQARGAGDTAQARLADLEQTARLLGAEEESARAETVRTETELEEARARLALTTTRFEEENALFQTADQERQALEARREELAREESAARLEWTAAREKLEGLERRVADLARVLEEGAEEVQRARGVASDQRANADRGETELEELAERRVVLLQQRSEFDERLSQSRATERAGREALEVLRLRAEEVTRELEQAMEALSERRLVAQRQELSREEILRRAVEDLGLAEHELRDPDEPPAAEGELEELDARVHELRVQLDQLGPVNVEAVDELEEVTGRLTFLETQRGDLDASRRSLESTLRKIDEESERLFLETFEEVRANFQASFRRLFGGGRADVVLEEGRPLLEAGIEIVARPPGREMLPIGLLSGGQRSMCALALLFAIFQARPSPFCVLDEVDAALDDANIGRFLMLLDGFRQRTQFLVVTHNKGTMGACDSLYGITMQARGVSSHVSVELDEVDAFVPEVRGGAAVSGPAPSAESPAESTATSTEEPEVELVPAPRRGGGARTVAADADAEAARAR